MIQDGCRITWRDHVMYRRTNRQTDRFAPNQPKRCRSRHLELLPRWLPACLADSQPANQPDQKATGPTAQMADSKKCRSLQEIPLFSGAFSNVFSPPLFSSTNGFAGRIWMNVNFSHDPYLEWWGNAVGYYSLAALLEGDDPVNLLDCGTPISLILPFAFLRSHYTVLAKSAPIYASTIFQLLLRSSSLFPGLHLPLLHWLSEFHFQ